MIGRIALVVLFLIACARPAPILHHNGDPISSNLFESLEELARIVDISYCVGSTGISKPFRCLGRCNDFEGFELVTTWNTGPLLSDSCGYIAISHEPYEKRVLVVFRGTYSIANTIADLSTTHAEYTPFPAGNTSQDICSQITPAGVRAESVNAPACPNCTIHTGFLKSWRNTRCTVIPAVEQALEAFPDHRLVLAGHSLGGAVAAIASLEFLARGHNVQVTTFGEPRIGNQALSKYIDERFNLNASSADDASYRRVTHVDDPVPLLPLEEWGYQMHAGEIYISKPALPPGRADLHACVGDADPRCIAGGGTVPESEKDVGSEELASQHWGVPSRYKLWQLFFAHRDYFWRLGLCIPSDPWDWSSGKLEGLNMSHDNEL